MKKNKIVLYIFLITLFSGCTDVLDKEELNAVNEDIWEDESTASAYINNLYANDMPEMSLGDNSGFTDEMYTSTTTYTKFMYGDVESDEITECEKVMTEDEYALIRRINIAIEGIEESSLSDSVKEPLLGQCLFFRAYKYWLFVQFYGGVPMVMHVQDPYTEDLNVARSKTTKSIELIVADLDSAIEYLPVEWEDDDDNGRITSGAAAAFKGRVLLSWASPMFNPDDSQTHDQRWQDAYDASAEAIELLSQMSTPRALYSDFGDIFTTDVLSNPEAVIFRRYDADAGDDYTSDWEGEVRPYSAGGGAGYGPTWELVKAFPMANGKRIDEEGSGYDSTYYWKDRDPRFYETIGYNGCDWSMTGSDYDQQWTYTASYVESKRSPGCGFYNRKATDPTVSADNTSLTSTSWIELRYAEVLMNYAECANEIGNTSEALTYIRQIRERAGIEAGDNSEYGISNSVSQDELRQLIMIERQVEFAFENKRYWDLRRRKMFREDLGDIVKKLNGTYRHGLITSAKTAYSSKYAVDDPSSEYDNWYPIDTLTRLGYVDINDSVNYNTYFTTKYKAKDKEPINYDELYDFFAIPKSIIESCDSVEQTIGWQYGTFDPLEE